MWPSCSSLGALSSAGALAPAVGSRGAHCGDGSPSRSASSGSVGTRAVTRTSFARRRRGWGTTSLRQEWPGHERSRRSGTDSIQRAFVARGRGAARRRAPPGVPPNASSTLPTARASTPPSSTARRCHSPSRRRSRPARPSSRLRAEEVGLTLVGWPRRAPRRYTASCSGYERARVAADRGRRSRPPRARSRHHTLRARARRGERACVAAGRAPASRSVAT